MKAKAPRTVVSACVLAVEQRVDAERRWRERPAAGVSVGVDGLPCRLGITDDQGGRTRRPRCALIGLDSPVLWLVDSDAPDHG